MVKAIDKAIRLCDSVYVNTSRYERYYGKIPKVYGNWAFKIGSEEKFFSGTFQEAKKAAVVYAQANNVTSIELLT